LGKDTTKNLVGQPIFKQIINIIPKEKFEELVLKSGGDKYYKTFFFVGTVGCHALWDIFTMRFNGQIFISLNPSSLSNSILYTTEKKSDSPLHFSECLLKNAACGANPTRFISNTT
jgi:hypothetical protein